MDSFDWFTLSISILSIIIGISALVFSIIYLIKISTLEKMHNDLDISKKYIDDIIDILIYKSVAFTDSGCIPGDQVIDGIMNEFKCSKIMALKIWYSRNLSIHTN